jgi:mRNA-degrading endonuclease HigB of HigAB toxin-antitoxin module
MENINMEKIGEKLTEGDYDARIVIDVTGDSFMVKHTVNLELDQIYLIFIAAVEYMDALADSLDAKPPKFLN